MGQILAMVIIPLLVGVVTYAALRLLWKREAKADHAARRYEFDVK